MKVIAIDFESFYEKPGRRGDYTPFSLKYFTIEEYVRSPQFEVVGVAVKVGEEKTEWFSGTHEETKEFLAQFPWETSAVLAHNCAFDGFILSHCYGIKPLYYFDTMSMAAPLVNGSLSLANLAKFYQLGVKGDEVINAANKRRKDFYKSELEEYGRYCINDVELTLKLFKTLYRQVSKEEMVIIHQTIKMFADPVFKLDKSILEAHLKDVKDKKANLLSSSGISNEDIMSNPKFAEVLKGLGVEPPKKISKTTDRETYAFAKTDAGLVSLLDHPDHKVQAVVAARLGGKSTIEETRTERLIGIASRGLLPVPLRYYGAKTGRWTAEGKINLQNLPRESRLRQAIKAPDGYAIVGADLSNIELRVALWLAGQTDALELLRQGKDLYRDFGSKIYNKPSESITPEERFVSKASVLSLVYGTAAAKLQSTIRTITMAQSEEIVSLYRSEYYNVRAMWGDGSKALRCLYLGGTMSFGWNDFFTVDDRGISLPNGFYMRYPELQMETGEKGPQYFYKDGKNDKERIYGAKVFQGLTQATARCILAWHMYQVSKIYTPALSIHDALYFVVPKTEAETALTFIQGVMATPPPWMPTIPLASEGGIGDSLASV